jgi:hypothetical protein
MDPVTTDVLDAEPPERDVDWGDVEEEPEDDPEAEPAPLTAGPPTMTVSVAEGPDVDV